MSLRYTKPERVVLKGNAEYSEEWVRARIMEDPGILGLGNVEVLAKERRQEKAGRLDLLLENKEEEKRYEVELMLGATDESHIIRCIEYWDIERRRYPGYDHCAVLIAEDVTSRFLNVISLFAGSLPMIAIQINALKVDNQIALSFVHVLSQADLRTDDESEECATGVDRSYWMKRTPEVILQMVDSCLSTINDDSAQKYSLKYNRGYIGLNDGVRSRNFVFFTLQQKYMTLHAVVKERDPWIKAAEKVGLEAGNWRRYFWVIVHPEDMKRCEQFMLDLLSAAALEYHSS